MYNVRSGKPFLIIKGDFGTSKPKFWRLILERSVSFLPEMMNFMMSHLQQQPIFRNFEFLDNLMSVMMCTKLKINEIILTLFSEVWAENPTPSSKFTNYKLQT